MPSVSKAQARTMRAVVHGWKPPASARIDVPVSVAKEYVAADKGRDVNRLPLHKRDGGRVQKNW